MDEEGWKMAVDVEGASWGGRNGWREAVGEALKAGREVEYWRETRQRCGRMEAGKNRNKDGRRVGERQQWVEGGRVSEVLEAGWRESGAGGVAGGGNQLMVK